MGIHHVSLTPYSLTVQHWTKYIVQVPNAKDFGKMSIVHGSNKAQFHENSRVTIIKLDLRNEYMGWEWNSVAQEMFVNILSRPPTPPSQANDKSQHHILIWRASKHSRAGHLKLQSYIVAFWLFVKKRYDALMSTFIPQNFKSWPLGDFEKMAFLCFFTHMA